MTVPLAAASTEAEWHGVDTMAGFVQTPQWRPRVTTRFEPRLTFVDATGQQVALRLTEADLWALGREVAEALLQLRSESPPDQS